MLAGESSGNLDGGTIAEPIPPKALAEQSTRSGSHSRQTGPPSPKKAAASRSTAATQAHSTAALSVSGGQGSRGKAARSASGEGVSGGRAPSAGGVRLLESGHPAWSAGWLEEGLAHFQGVAGTLRGAVEGLPPLVPLPEKPLCSMSKAEVRCFSGWLRTPCEGDRWAREAEPCHRTYDLIVWDSTRYT